MDDSHLLSTIIAWACLVIFLPYVLGPIVIWFGQRQPAEPVVEVFDVNDPSLPPEPAGYFRKTAEALAPLGFEVAAGLTVPSQVANVKALVFLWANRFSKETIDAACIYARTPKGTRLHTTYIGISTRLRDGTVVRTNNTKVIGAFPKRSGFLPQSFPMVQDADRLYRVHEARLERYGIGSDRILRLDEEFHGDAAAYLAQTMVEELQDAAKAGYMRRSADGRVYRPTWKGALLMTWGQCWPIKGIRTRHRTHKARNLLAELENR